MPDGLSEVEKANWLQLKYSIKMDVAVETINNIPLLKKIDEFFLFFLTYLHHSNYPNDF